MWRRRAAPDSNGHRSSSGRRLAPGRPPASLCAGTARQCREGDEHPARAAARVAPPRGTCGRTGVDRRHRSRGRRASPGRLDGGPSLRGSRQRCRGDSESLLTRASSRRDGAAGRHREAPALRDHAGATRVDPEHREGNASRRDRQPRAPRRDASRRPTAAGGCPGSERRAASARSARPPHSTAEERVDRRAGDQSPGTSQTTASGGRVSSAE